jgi:hypothetical protein
MHDLVPNPGVRSGETRLSEPDISQFLTNTARWVINVEEYLNTRILLKSLTQRDNCQMMCTHALLWTSVAGTCNLRRGSDRVARSS